MRTITNKPRKKRKKKRKKRRIKASRKENTLFSFAIQKKNVILLSTYRDIYVSTASAHQKQSEQTVKNILQNHKNNRTNNTALKIVLR